MYICPTHCATRQVMFLKTDHAKAIECYRTVLKQKPNNYEALQKLTELLRRAGQLNEVLRQSYAIAENGGCGRFSHHGHTESLQFTVF